VRGGARRSRSRSPTTAKRSSARRLRSAAPVASMCSVAPSGAAPSASRLADCITAWARPLRRSSRARCPAATVGSRSRTGSSRRWSIAGAVVVERGADHPLGQLHRRAAQLGAQPAHQPGPDRPRAARVPAGACARPRPSACSFSSSRMRVASGAGVVADASALGLGPLDGVVEAASGVFQLARGLLGLVGPGAGPRPAAS
jgi:hypothetical protein